MKYFRIIYARPLRAQCCSSDVRGRDSFFQATQILCAIFGAIFTASAFVVVVVQVGIFVSVFCVLFSVFFFCRVYMGRDGS